MAQQVKKKFIGNDQVDGSKIKLLHGQTLRGTDALGNEIDILANIQTEIDQAQTDSQSYTDQKIADLVDSAPALLDTLNELAAAIGDDPNFVTTVVNQVAGVQSNLDQEILDRIADVNAEESRALAAEGVLQSNIDTVQSNLDQEILDRQADVDAEESRALAAEGVLQGNINTVSANLAQEILDRQADVDAEESRALAAEQLLEDGIDAIGMMIPLIEANITAIDDAKVNRTGDTITGPLVFPDSMNPSNTTTVGFGNIQVTVDDGAGVYYDASHGIDVILNKNDSNTQINHYAEIAADGISLYNDDGNGGPQSAFIPTNDFQVTTKKYVDDEIAALSSGGVAAVQSELDSTQVGAGLGTDGSYTAPVGSNYLGSAVSLKDADSKLDTQIKVVADGLSQEIIDRTADVDAEQLRAETAEGVLQDNIDIVSSDLAQEIIDRTADVDAEQSRAEAAELLLQNNINDVAADLAQEVLDRQADVDAEESRALAAEGVLQGNIDSEESARIAADDALDSRLDVLESVVWFKEKFSITNGQTSVTLSHTPEASSMSAFVDRLAIHEGASEDYTISGTTMTFLNDLVSPGSQQLGTGDTVYVKYQYKM